MVTQGMNEITDLREMISKSSQSLTPLVPAPTRSVVDESRAAAGPKAITRKRTVTHLA
jgi:hypothetical protein